MDYYEKFCNLAKARGGIVLSKKEDYINAQTKLKIKCCEEHEFLITLSNLNLNRWCPHCSQRKNEKYTKELVQLLTKKKFQKVKPKWLKNKKGNLLEIDIYNDELKLGIEYNGIQHYKFTKIFHKSEEDFQNRLEDDKLKVKLCEENNVKLIVVPYNCDIKQFIINKLEELHIEFKDTDEPILIKNDIKEKLLNIVKEKEGIILSKQFELTSETIELQCKKEHKWETKIKNILRGLWCNVCGHEVLEETKLKISNKLKENAKTIEGKEKIKKSFEKRTETFKKIKEDKINSIKNKVCTNCVVDKAINEFYVKKASQDGYQSWCKECTKLNKKNYKPKKLIL